ncbi:MAG: hypothetical protein WAV43_06035 [Streptococcus parauberis]
MTTNEFSILTDYEGLLGQLGDILQVAELASMEDDRDSIISLLNTSNLALKQLLSNHRTIIGEYRKEPEVWVPKV